MTKESNLPGWAREASLGIFVHWGPYSVPAWAEPTGAWGAVPEAQWFSHNAYAEWYGNTIRIADSPAAKHHAAAHGGRPYLDFLDDWEAQDFDPSDWAQLFHSAGADYVIPVTKHHDGVTLWDAPGRSDLSTVARGPRRDLIAPLAEAVRELGMRFGVYYSGGLDWSFTDYPPIESMSDVSTLRPNDAAYAAYATAHLRDLISKFRPSVIWNDIDWPDAGKLDGSLKAALDHYREVVPDGIVNDRWGADIWDYRTSEYSHDVQNELGVGWEHNRGLGFSFGFNQVEDASLTMSSQELARLYADVVSRGGRLLINVGPDASGRIPSLQRRALEGLARWMPTVKPLTHGRSPLPEGAVAVEGASWWRAWSSNGKVVVIADRQDVTVTADGRPCVVIPLPDAPNA